MIVTTTDSVGERTIRGYRGLVYGTDIYLVGGLLGGGMVNQENLFGSAIKSATRKMEEKAALLGANAIIGVKVNMTSPGADNHMIVTVTGTAVIVSDATEEEWFASYSTIPDIDETISGEGRYSRIMLDEGFCDPDSNHIKFINGAIVYDKHYKKDFLQLSFLNTTGFEIESIKVRVRMHDSEDAVLDEDDYSIEGEFGAGEETYNINISTETNGAVTAKVECIGYLIKGTISVQEDSNGFIVCSKCNTKQKSGPFCKRCGVPLLVEKYRFNGNEENQIVDRRIPIFVEIDEDGQIVCPKCGRKQGKNSSCSACMQKFILPQDNSIYDSGDSPAVEEVEEDIEEISTVFVSVDSEGWVICPECNTRQKAGPVCKRCGVVFHNPNYYFGEVPMSEAVPEEDAEEVSPENIVVRPDENGCITCPHCSKYQSKKSKCFVCKKPINLEV